MQAKLAYNQPFIPDSLVGPAAVRIGFKAWEKDYLRPEKGTLFVLNDEDDQDGITTSEAIGYGMMIEVLMAEKGDSSQHRFEQLYAYARRHRAKCNPYLMSWKQYGKSKADAGDTATDGDLDIAFALLLAHEQWDAPDDTLYLNDALHTLSAVKKYQIDQKELIILRGDSGLFEHKHSVCKVTRTSDFMPDHFRVFDRYDHDPIWQKLITVYYARFRNIQSTYSKTYHLFPEYVDLAGGQTRLMTFLSKKECDIESLNDGGHVKNPFGKEFGLNACRIPWRLASDDLTFGDTTSHNILVKLNAGAKLYAAGDACLLTNVLRIDDRAGSGRHRQLVTKDLVDDSASDQLLAPLSLAAQVAKDDAWQQQLTQLFMDKKTCDASPSAKCYYENTIHFLCIILLSGNYWTPCTPVKDKP